MVSFALDKDCLNTRQIVQKPSEEDLLDMWTGESPVFLLTETSLYSVQQGETLLVHRGEGYQCLTGRYFERRCTPQKLLGLVLILGDLSGTATFVHADSTVICTVSLFRDTPLTQLAVVEDADGYLAARALGASAVALTPLSQQRQVSRLQFEVSHFDFGETVHALGVKKGAQVFVPSGSQGAQYLTVATASGVEACNLAYLQGRDGTFHRAHPFKKPLKEALLCNIHNINNTNNLVVASQQARHVFDVNWLI